MKIAICDFELRTLELIKNFVADTDTLGDQPFKILSYENPFDMLAYYSRYRDIDIILLNVEMKSGYDVAKELRKLDKKVEIIFLGVIRQIKRCLFRQIKTGLSEHLTMG